MLPGTHSSMVGFAAPGYRPGGSLRAWRDYFEQAVICGLDVQPDTQFEDEARIVTRLCNSTEAAQVLQLMDGNFPKQFDIIIDDGSHYADDQFKTIHNMFPYLASQGIYIVEDLVGDGFRKHLDIILSISGNSPYFLLGPENNLFATIKSGDGKSVDTNYVLTTWGTALYVDEGSERLRHGPTATVPQNIRLKFELTRATIVHSRTNFEKPIRFERDGYGS